ncbi:MAG TPA: carboxypeptidase-like regulatory domain-containing protein, partial [Terrimicrobiaceae bacterium]
MVDQNGDPVAAAKVTYGAIDHFLSKGSDYSGYSDAHGYFSINGIKGIALTVGVWKEGYYGIDGKSAGAFAYGIKPDSTRSLPPTKDKPAIFLLHKMGETEPLIQVSSRQFDVPPTGQTVSIDLATGRTDRGNLQVASWIGNNKQRPFDWRYQLSVPGGGLIERKGQFDFEAPADGYQPAIEVNMPPTAENWNSRLTKQYFARLADGRYARFSIRFFAGDRNFIVFERSFGDFRGIFARLRRLDRSQHLPEYGKASRTKKTTLANWRSPKVNATACSQSGSSGWRQRPSCFPTGL